MARVLLVDSDRALRLALADALVKAGHEVEAVSAIGFALDSLRSHEAEVVITDTMNAAFIGARALILVTSLDASENSRVAAFEAGADDFVARPLSMREMVLRVQALLRRRRRSSEAADVIELDKLRIDRSALRLRVDGQPVVTTTLEIRLLIYLAEQGGRAVTRERLLEDVWGDPALSVRVVDTSIRRLRAKLGPARDLLRTLRNVGYQLRAD